jgi:Family of unknown function (DUF5683)
MERAARFLGVILLFLTPVAATAQETTTQVDTANRAPGDWRLLGADSISAPHRQKKSTTTAVLLSAILPGAGQFYNESYGKVPIATGLGVYFGYEFFSNNSQYQHYKDLYSESTADGGTGNQQYYNLREFYRKERDRFGWYFLLLYIANLVDAYVDANLSDFEISDDVSVRLVPGVLESPGASVSLGLRVTF